jgi:nickel transport protein
MNKNLHRDHGLPHNGRWLVFFLCAVFWLVFCSAQAWAHKVTIFAWVEGDTVHTQSKFSGGKRAQDSTVVVYDKEGNLLLEGKTNEKGEFSFKVPKKTDLKIVLKAAMGHAAEWTIPAEEITAVAAGPESGTPETGGEAAPQSAIPSTEAKASEGQAVASGLGLSRQEVKEIVDAALDQKLAPIAHMLADSFEQGPKASEVIGGIGYIFGLVGVAMYFSSRRKRGA